LLLGKSKRQSQLGEVSLVQLFRYIVIKGLVVIKGGVFFARELYI